jgi:sugar O-acyltransferase (sialic acid O-acetyltransferase NeuD family)
VKNIIILGASGHACVVHDVFASENKYNVVGFVDPDFEKETTIQGVPVLGNDKDIPSIVRHNEIEGFFVALGVNHIRQSLVSKVLVMGLNLELVTGVHQHAVVSPHAKLGAGVVVMPGSIINAGSTIAEGCVVNTGATVDHDSTLKPYAHIGPGAHLGGNCFVGHRSYIGLGASVIHGVKVGNDAVVGAGSVVIREVEKLSLTCGVPAKTMRSREPNESYL